MASSTICVKVATLSLNLTKANTVVIECSAFISRFGHAVAHVYRAGFFENIVLVADLAPIPSLSLFVVLHSNLKITMH